MVEEKDVRKWLAEVFDPEIPVLSLVDLGVVVAVRITPDLCEIDITPTYSGCPAMQRMESDIIEKLQEKGLHHFRVNLVLSPAWHTGMISEEGRKKLLEYGIAPPEDEPDISTLFAEPVKVACPQCRSKNTKMISLFGSTACKAQYQCKDCLEPFDYFKCLK